MHAVFRRHMDVPSKNPVVAREPGGQDVRRARSPGCISFGALFFVQAKKSHPSAVRTERFALNQKPKVDHGSTGSPRTAFLSWRDRNRSGSAHPGLTRFALPSHPCAGADRSASCHRQLANSCDQPHSPSSQSDSSSACSSSIARMPSSMRLVVVSLSPM